MARYIDEGHDVYVCIITKGHSSMFPEDVLRKLRDETINAHNYLGVEKTIFLDFPAVMLSEVPKWEINGEINEVIETIDPQIVFIPHFGDMHLDHSIVGQAAMVGLRPIRENKVLEVYSYETLSETEWNVPHVSNTFIPNTYIDISNFIDKKIEAMSYFTTQLYNFPHPRSLEAIKSLAKLRGSTIGVKSAEAFSLIRRIIL